MIRTSEEMSKLKGERLAPRLVEIIIKLATGQKFTTAELAQEFGVDQRTIRRDLNERLVGYVERDDDKRYFISHSLLGKLTTSEFRRLVNHSGIGDLYPDLSNRFIKELLDPASDHVYEIDESGCENSREYQESFKKLGSSIKDQFKVSFQYNSKQYSGIQPYRLRSAKGIWYLLAVDENKIKSFSLAKISCLIIQELSFSKDMSIEQTIDEQEGIWVSDQKIDVTLIVDSEIADYFLRRPILPNQEIVKELQDGSLEVSSRVNHLNQIVPHVKYWMPHITVLDPKEIRQKILDDFNQYQVNN